MNEGFSKGNNFWTALWGQVWFQQVPKGRCSLIGMDSMQCCLRLERDAGGGGTNAGEVGNGRAECLMNIIKILALCEAESTHTLTPPIFLTVANGIAI